MLLCLFCLKYAPPALQSASHADSGDNLARWPSEVYIFAKSRREKVIVYVQYGAVHINGNAGPTTDIYRSLDPR